MKQEAKADGVDKWSHNKREGDRTWAASGR